MSGKYAFVESLRELRFLFCQTSSHSANIRSWLLQSYPVMKKKNPHIPILLREAEGTRPRVFARYQFGAEKEQSLEGLSGKGIEEAVTSIVQRSIQQQQQQKAEQLLQ